jgi:RNA polymerase-binding transcription factor DksA
MKSARAATPPTIPRRWTWHYHELLRMREGLLQLRAEWDAALREREAPEQPCAVGEVGPRQLLAELASEAADLAEVEAALARILAGRYGVCELTGRRIPRERLKASPWTRVSVDERGAVLR